MAQITPVSPIYRGKKTRMVDEYEIELFEFLNRTYLTLD